MIVQLAVKGAPTDAEFLGREGSVALALLQGASHQRNLRFHEIEREWTSALMLRRD
jgi:hypothetical protein